MAITRIVVAIILILGVYHLGIGLLVSAKECNEDDFVYGENGVVDELLTCSLTESFDLDLTPHGDHSKSTSKTLVEQGLSNRTSILHARLSGIWTAKRPGLIETGWRCDGAKTTATAIVEVSGLSLEVIEKMEASMSRNQHRLSLHKPCKTFDLPVWMCRQTKPIYRKISTWVNRAYFNLTLAQGVGAERATVERLSLMFTCPETFKQRITHSPSATYLLSRYSPGDSRPATNSQQQQQQQPKKPTIVKRESKGKRPRFNSVQDLSEFLASSHPNSFTATQSGNMPVSPLYHNSVKVITSEVTRVLRSAFEMCIDSLEVNLNLIRDYTSFKGHKYNLANKEQGESDTRNESFGEDYQSGISNECSNKLWVKSRIELTNQLSSVESGEPADARLKGHPSKRNQIGLRQPEEPNELLDPYGFYHDLTADLMID